MVRARTTTHAAHGQRRSGKADNACGMSTTIQYNYILAALLTGVYWPVARQTGSVVMLHCVVLAEPAASRVLRQENALAQESPEAFGISI